MARIEYNKEEMAFLNALQVGECGAVNVKRIKDNTETQEKWFSIELAERIGTNSSNSFNALAYMNPRDTRFTQSGGPRRQWLNGSADMIMQVLPNVTQAQLDSLQIGIGRVNALVKHPMAGQDSNRRFKLQIVGLFESQLEDGCWELQNYDRAKKTAGSGPNARAIKGLNTETGAIEQIFERMVVRTSIMDEQGVWVNEGGWAHQTIEEYTDQAVTNTVETVTTATAMPQLD
jgi:hypothetical protein